MGQNINLLNNITEPQKKNLGWLSPKNFLLVVVSWICFLMVIYSGYGFSNLWKNKKLNELNTEKQVMEKGLLPLKEISDREKFCQNVGPAYFSILELLSIHIPPEAWLQSIEVRNTERQIILRGQVSDVKYFSSVLSDLNKMAQDSRGKIGEFNFSQVVTEKGLEFVAIGILK
jgi:hypothetical protein